MSYSLILSGQKIFKIRAYSYLLFAFLLLLTVYFTYENVKIYSSNYYVTKKAMVLGIHKRLEASEFRVFSQNREDGVIQELINLFDLNDSKFYVEIGTQSGIECNSR